MQSFSRGWSFLTQSWRMAFKDKDLIKPSIYALLVGFFVSILGLIPIVGAYLLLGDSGFGQALTFVLGALLVFANFVVTYVFSGMTAYLIFGYLSEGDGRMDKAWNIVKRDFFDIVTLAAVSTFVNMLKRGSRRRNKGGVAGILAGMIRSAASLLEVLWTEASYLILPAMVIDDLNLKDGALRIWNITQNNLVLVGISTVGVRAVTFVIGVLLWLAGAVIGFVVAVVVSAVLGSTETAVVIGLIVGALTFLASTLVASIISTYTAISYHTCLYIWAREAERALALGQSIDATAPAPLAAVLALG